MKPLQEYLQFLTTSVTQNLYWVWSNLSIFSSPLVILDVLIVAVIFYYVYQLFKHSKAFNILIGIAMLGIIAVLSQVLQLKAFSWLLSNAITVLVVAIPIVFQPEIRNFLDRLGRSSMSVRTFWSVGKGQSEHLIQELFDALLWCKQEKTGALLVFERLSRLDAYFEGAIMLHAQISKELICSIFQKQSPLHDGAVVLRGDSIIAAACTMPLSEKALKNHGLRHQAAQGVSDFTDALALVVSEETGSLAKCSRGRITEDLTDSQLLSILRKFYYVSEKKLSFIDSVRAVLQNFSTTDSSRY